MKITISIRIAETQREIMEVKRLIASMYNSRYGVMFSKRHVDLHEKIDPWPDVYVYGEVKGEIVACAALYTGITYIEKYGMVSSDDITQLLKKTKSHNDYNPVAMREYCRIVVKQGWENKGVGRFFLSASHSKDFIYFDNKIDAVLLICAKISIFKHIHDRVGINTRKIKPFPNYKVHEFYRSKNNPMESRLILPKYDVPDKYFNMKIPGTYTMEDYAH